MEGRARREPRKGWVGIVLCWMLGSAGSLLVVGSKIEVPPQPSIQRAIIIDERFSALREAPGWQGRLRQRLRRGREVWLIGRPRGQGGDRFYRVALSRRVRGWVHEAALIRPGRGEDAVRIWRVIEDADDDYVKVSLAKLCTVHFRDHALAPRAWLLLGETMTRVALRLTKEAQRRLTGIDPALRRPAMLGYVSLDRYYRLGIQFRYDPSKDQLEYDGEAFHQLRRRYPRSEEAQRLPTPGLPHNEEEGRRERHDQGAGANDRLK
jgi:hypothetical protein